MLDFEEDPLPDHWNRWGLGTGGALLALIAAGVTLTRMSMHVPGRRGGFDLHGGDVTALAFLLTALAVFLHVHFFWTGTERFHFARQLLRILAIVTGLVAFGTILVHQTVSW